MDITINPTEFKILIVDDNEFNVQLLVIMLAKYKYKIVTGNSGASAMQQVEKESPDLILLDIMMPDISGYDVAQKLKSDPKYQDIPILFLSALNSNEDIVKGFKYGAEDYITKPFNKEELVTRIHHQILMIAARRQLIKQNDALRKSIQERDKFYSLIAHDLRSPMGILKMSLSLLTEVPEETVGKEMFEVIAMANRTAEEMFEMLDNLLKWAKWQRGVLVPVFQSFNIVELMSSMAAFFSTVTEIRKINIVLDVGKLVDVNVTMDIEMIRTVIRNLTSNAIKYSEDGSKIILSLEEGADDVVVHVQDFGRGIKEEDKCKIFDGDGTHSTYGVHNEEGSGLGLVISQEFIAKHNGKIWFTSEEGAGSIFSFSIPKKRPANTSNQE
ncbi:MAG: hybrid sensor histidine kinase/response regulator [Bacteroidales bacterium]|nr:hybrid sensor histidine kinase/response regulator [Bacteroidales bacterium]MDD3201582.1 hybrid sensor histidine kinase/response regulator [Bacteroidales bacterium]